GRLAAGPQIAHRRQHLLAVDREVAELLAGDRDHGDPLEVAGVEPVVTLDVDGAHDERLLLAEHVQIGDRVGTQMTAGAQEDNDLGGCGHPQILAERSAAAAPDRPCTWFTAVRSSPPAPVDPWRTPRARAARRGRRRARG